jgi:two-component system sensor histidine kinase FlrB
MSWSAIEGTSLETTATTGEWMIRNTERRVSISRNERVGGGGVILLLQDITEAHTMEAQLQRHKRLSAMGEMAAALAHQLRTPLSTALLYTSNLRDSSLAEEERGRFIDKALGRLRHLEALIKDMLVFVRGGKGTHEHIPVAELLSEVQQVIEPQMLQHGVKFEASCTVEGASINGSREAIAGALTNLLANAMQACAGGGSVTLRAGLEKDSVVVFSVKDDGRGIPPEILERLFEPFFTTRTEGTGLGLAIVREVAQVHGGDISVKSKLGSGSEFQLRVPKVNK